MHKNNRPKIMILSETLAGDGHHMAAKAIEDSLKTMNPSPDIKLDQALPYVSQILESGSRFLYNNTIKRAPVLWGWAYERETLWSKWFKNKFSSFASYRLTSYIDSHQPDIVVITHAYCLGGLGELRSRNKYPFTLGAVITDFDINSFWIHPSVDFYIVATEYLKEKMIRFYGIDSKKVYATGIPINKEFAEQKEKKTQRKELGLNPDQFTILLSGGGTGFGPLPDILKQLLFLEIPVQIVIITGKNKVLYEEIKKISVPKQHTLHLFGYVTNMHQFMQSADLMISKPGGMTLSEALATSLPVIIYQPIPGQELRNARFLLQEKVAEMANNLKELEEITKLYIMSGKKREEMKQRASRLGRPESSWEAANIILKHWKSD